MCRKKEKKQCGQKLRVEQTDSMLISWQWPGELDCRGSAGVNGCRQSRVSRFSSRRSAGAHAQCQLGALLYLNPTQKNNSFSRWTVMWFDSKLYILTCLLRTFLLDLCHWVSVHNEQLNYRAHLWAVLSIRKHNLALWHFIFKFFCCFSFWGLNCQKINEAIFFLFIAGAYTHR